MTSRLTLADARSHNLQARSGSANSLWILLDHLSNHAADVINVKDYGAVGDGVTDDSTAIQAAIDVWRALSSTVNSEEVGVLLYFPPGVYVVGTQLDMTAIRLEGATIEGYGATLHGKCTGKPVIDSLYSRFITFAGLTVVGDAVNTPSIGILYGRKNSSVADSQRFINISIKGTFSVASLYNHGAETAEHRGCRFWNDSSSTSAYAAIFDGANNFDITSDFVTVTSAVGTEVSYNENNFYACDFRKQTTGKAIILSGSIRRWSFLGCFGVSWDDWVVFYYKPTSGGIQQMTLDMHMEQAGALGSFLIDNVNAPAAGVFIRGLKMRDHNPIVTTAIMDVTGSTRQVFFDGADLEFSGIASGVPIFGSTSGSSANIVISGEIRWEDADTLDLSNIRFTGTIYIETATAITHTLGTYNIVRRPFSADARALEVKGELRVSGLRDTATADNYVSLTGNVTGSSPELLAGGVDTNLDLRFTPKGTGRIRFGVHAGIGAETVTGYITIKDSAGTSRKIAVVS